MTYKPLFGVSTWILIGAETNDDLPHVRSFLQSLPAEQVLQHVCLFISQLGVTWIDTITSELKLRCPPRTLADKIIGMIRA